MTVRRPERRPIALILFVLAGLLLAGILALGSLTNSARRQYQAEAAVTVAPTMAPPSLYAKPTDALLRAGSVGIEVKQLQERLKALGYYTGGIDGQYGNGTKAAVQRFQEQHGLNPDGMAGAETLGILYGSAAQPLQLTPKPALPSLGKSLPILVNRSHPLEESYLPNELVSLKDIVPSDLLILKDPGVRASKPAVEALIAMINAAKAAGLDVWQVSEGYRSFQRQRELFDAQLQTYMKVEGLSETAARSATEKTVASPGTSEHHTGLAFDLTVPGFFFGDTPQAQWLEDNCWDYGFILRYTSNKEEVTGYLPEPWHVRYVGMADAKFMQQHSLALEEYLALYQTP